MNHSTKKHLHEKNRKRLKHDMQLHAREAARRGRSRLPFWLLVLGMGLLLSAVAFITFR